MKKSSAVVFFVVAGAVFALGKCSAGQAPGEQQTQSAASLRYAQLKAEREARHANQAQRDQSLQQLRDLAIADSALEKCIEQALAYALSHSGKNPISHATQLEHLACPNQNIERLTGLEHFRQLSSLDLSGNRIRDTEGLEQLHQLKQLNLNNNKITSIWALQGLDKLEVLKLKNNPVGDLHYLTGFDQLRQVDYRFDPRTEKCRYLASIKRALKTSRVSLTIPSRCLDEFGQAAQLEAFE